MGKERPPSFIDLVYLHDSIRRELYRDARHTSPPSEILEALTSGMDSVLTILDASSAEFYGLSSEAARKVCEYFRSESCKYENNNIETSIWYLAWAETIEKVYIK